MSYLDSDEEEEFVIEYSRRLLPGHLLDTSTEDLDEDVFNISGVSSIESPEGGVDEIPYAPAVIPSGVISPDHRVTQMQRAVSIILPAVGCRCFRGGCQLRGWPYFCWRGS